MLDGARSVGFVGVSDLDAARAFYGDTLGLRLRDESPHALIATAGGTTLRVTAVGTPVVAPYTVAGWDVDDIAATVDGLVARGVVFARYDGLGQDERGVWTTPDGTKVAWFLDPDGNNLSLTEFSASHR
jgi:catechol 2,3-dioxygenase-like lactoylglutathione lyase family enzyme